MFAADRGVALHEVRGTVLKAQRLFARHQRFGEACGAGEPLLERAVAALDPLLVSLAIARLGVDALNLAPICLLLR